MEGGGDNAAAEANGAEAKPTDTPDDQDDSSSQKRDREDADNTSSCGKLIWSFDEMRSLVRAATKCFFDDAWHGDTRWHVVSEHMRSDGFLLRDAGKAASKFWHIKAAFKRIKAWKMAGNEPPFEAMSADLRKQMKLPLSFRNELYEDVVKFFQETGLDDGTRAWSVEERAEAGQEEEETIEEACHEGEGGKKKREASKDIAGASSQDYAKNGRAGTVTATRKSPRISQGANRDYAENGNTDETARKNRPRTSQDESLKNIETVLLSKDTKVLETFSFDSILPENGLHDEDANRHDVFIGDKEVAHDGLPQHEATCLLKEDAMQNGENRMHDKLQKDRVAENNSKAMSMSRDNVSDLMVGNIMEKRKKQKHKKKEKVKSTKTVEEKIKKKHGATVYAQCQGPHYRWPYPADTSNMMMMMMNASPVHDVMLQHISSTSNQLTAYIQAVKMNIQTINVFMARSYDEPKG